MFFFLLLVGAGPLWLLNSSTVAEAVTGVGGIVFMFGVVLNPQSFIQPLGTLISLENMPRICRILIGGGLVVSLRGIAAKHLPTLFT